MAIVEQMRKPVPDGGVIRDIGKQAFLYLLGKIGPQLKGRPANPVPPAFGFDWLLDVGAEIEPVTFKP